jgi:hypothetical protein
MRLAKSGDERPSKQRLESFELHNVDFEEGGISKATSTMHEFSDFWILLQTQPILRMALRWMSTMGHFVGTGAVRSTALQRSWVLSGVHECVCEK